MYELTGQYEKGFDVICQALRINKLDIKSWMTLFGFAEFKPTLLPRARAMLSQLGTPEIKKLVLLKKDRYQYIFLKNIEKMVMISRRYGNIKIILCNYPANQCVFNDYIPSLNRLFNIETIDFESIFTDLIKEKGFTYYFILDMHCNNNDYDVMAKVLLPYVENSLK